MLIVMNVANGYVIVRVEVSLSISLCHASKACHVHFHVVKELFFLIWQNGVAILTIHKTFVHELALILVEFGAFVGNGLHCAKDLLVCKILFVVRHQLVSTTTLSSLQTLLMADLCRLIQRYHLIRQDMARLDNGISPGLWAHGWVRERPVFLSFAHVGWVSWFYSAGGVMILRLRPLHRLNDCRWLLQVLKRILICWRLQLLMISPIVSVELCSQPCLLIISTLSLDKGSENIVTPWLTLSDVIARWHIDNTVIDICLTEGLIIMIYSRKLVLSWTDSDLLLACE